MVRCKVLIVAGALLCGTAGAQDQRFENPPKEARPYVWWHWINGNTSKDGIRKDLLALPTPTTDAPVQETIDLTDKVKDGVLTWKAPAGKWRIYRFGASLTGKQNHPAPPAEYGSSCSLRPDGSCTLGDT